MKGMTAKKSYVLLACVCTTTIYLIFSAKPKLHDEPHPATGRVKHVQQKNLSYWISKRFFTSAAAQPANDVKQNTAAVILLTMMRSGSSIVGSIFDERENVTYLYEPLYPFGEECDNKSRDNALALLRHASTCHFENFKSLYDLTDRYDKWSRCVNYSNVQHII